ncbi:selenide, water dikinase SelD [Hasllibacter halocynthiae]|nr:selenide, water dikinase SelD [Hasllibacter halocynthiae]
METLPLTRDLVLVGGGHAHALVLRRWGMDPLPGGRLTLIDPGATTAYTGMLPGLVAGHYRRPETEIDLVRLARFAGARLIRARAAGIDRQARRIAVEGRPPVAYDVASFDVGLTGAMPDLPGFADHGHPAKPLGPFADAWARFLPGGGPAAVLGGGVGGVELALAMRHALLARHGRAEVAVIDAGRALSGISPKAAAALRERLARAGIALHEGAAAIRVGPGAVTLAGGREVPSAFTAGAAGGRPWPLLGGLGLALEDGWLAVDDRLRTSDPRVFAAGDCAFLAYAPRPKAGVYAVRAAPVLAANLRDALRGREPRRRFRPQRSYLKLITLGAREAVADRGGRAVTAAPGALWRWKDRIDRQFMARLSDLAPMPRPRAPRVAAAGLAEALAGAPPCGACGAKVGGATLAAALAALPGTRREDVETPPGDDAAVLRVGGARQVLTTDHLRAFTLDPWLMARIAALHALGDVRAMGAAPQAALAQITLPRLAPRLEAETLREVMAGAASALVPAGCAIAGGHTTQGPEMQIGFTLAGLADRPVTLAGARPGDALVLTRPIGSGTILAGEMALAATGPEVAACLDLLSADQAAEAEALRDARAMTDVTGFGLLGHAAAMAAASGVTLRIDLEAVPLMDGALRLAEGGTRSSLFAANAEGMAGRVLRPEGARSDLLLDPQTAGGLLAAVDPAAVPALRAAIPHLAQIGGATAPDGFDVRVR